MSSSQVAAEPKHLSQPVRVSRVWPHQDAWHNFLTLVNDCFGRLMGEQRHGEGQALLRLIEGIEQKRNKLGVFLASWGPAPVAFMLLAPGTDTLCRRVMWVEGAFMGKAPARVRRAAREALVARMVFEAREQGVSHILTEAMAPAMGRWLSRLGFEQMAVTYQMEIDR